MKRGETLKKKSNQSISKIQRDIWQECRRIIKARHGNLCYTCGRGPLEGSNYQIGHMWAKASVGAYLKYDLRILRPQDYFCNINLGGNGAVFYERMLEEVGEEAMEALRADRNVTVKAIDHYTKILAEYKTIDR